MGIVLSYVTAREDTIDRVLETPPAVAHLIQPEDGSGLAAELATQCDAKRGFFPSLFGKKRPTPVPDPFPLREGEGEEGDLDKVFGAVLFLVSEKLEANNPFDGESVGRLLYGYAGIYAVRPNRVKTVAATAAALSRDDARARFDPAAMAATGIYELVDDEEEEFESAWEYLSVLRDDWGRAAERDLGMIVFFA